jgi:hypothetical protein
MTYVQANLLSSTSTRSVNTMVYLESWSKFTFFVFSVFRTLCRLLLRTVMQKLGASSLQRFKAGDCVTLVNKLADIEFKTLDIPLPQVNRDLPRHHFKLKALVASRLGNQSGVIEIYSFC